VAEAGKQGLPQAMEAEAGEGGETDADRQKKSGRLRQAG
jgi:hypothetical protein